MLSFEVDHDHDQDQDLTQFLFSPQPQSIITLMPPEEFTTEIIKGQPEISLSNLGKKKLSELHRGNYNSIETPKDNEIRRINHRDAEKKRRQEMNLLYTSLRSKLPKEHVLQGKSISNDTQGAVNYINHLKQKIGWLAKKRDDLKKLVDSAAGTSNSHTYDRDKTSVKVECGKSGVEVILKTSSVKGFPLSKFLRVLHGEGMAVVNCTSNRANEALIHVINCEVDAERSCDQTKLEQKLRDLVYNTMHLYDSEISISCVI